MEETARFAAKERTRKRQLGEMRERRLRNNVEYYPEGLYGNLDRRRDSLSVYSEQDIDLPWERPGRYSIRNSV